MTDWTDDEVQKAATTATVSSCVFGGLRWMRTLLHAVGAVHPVDARERERTAFAEGWNGGLVKCSGERVAPFDVTRDCRYPSLLPPPAPPPLVLSGVKWTSQMFRGISSKPTEIETRVWSADNGTTGDIYPPIKTASDARALAEWLTKYGTEEERK